MSKSRIFIGVSISFVTGIFLGSKFSIPGNIIFICFAVCASLAALSYYIKFSVGAIFALFLFFSVLGIWRIQTTFVPNQFSEAFGVKQKLEGYVVEDVDLRTDKQMLTFQPQGYSQRILMTTTLGQKFFYGDRLVVEGKIKEPNNFEDFDYKHYLEKSNVYAVMQYPKILILKSNQLSFVKYQLLKIKYNFASYVSKFLPEPHNSLLLGILIGARKTLPEDAVENFNATGTSHIVAVSGFNITIIISALMSLAVILGRRASLWLCLMVIAGFTVLAGASASVLRAATMGVLLLVSFNTGRQYAITPSLCLAAAVMLMLNPRILYWDVGFQLSFAATLGIVYLLPQLEKLTEKLPGLLGVKSIIFATLSATIATLPLILYYFGRLSLVALLANALILPVVPYAMLSGFLIVIPYLSAGFAIIAEWLLSYILNITAILADLPFAYFEVKISGTWLLLLSFSVLLVYLAARHYAKTRNRGFEPTRDL